MVDGGCEAEGVVDGGREGGSVVEDKVAGTLLVAFVVKGLKGINPRWQCSYTLLSRRGPKNKQRYYYKLHSIAHMIQFRKRNKMTTRFHCASTG